ncbi:MAG: DUF1456 family protein [Chitinophagales bacterium]
MTNNDIFRRLRYIFDFNDSQMIELFRLAEYETTRAEVSDWLKKEDDEAFQELSDENLAVFLNGLINDKRGKREGPQPKPETFLDNNMILRKLKIALNLRDEDMLKVFALADVKVSKHELSAFFRKPNQSQYRICKDQYLRNFLKGMQVKYRKDV